MLEVDIKELSQTKIVPYDIKDGTGKKIIKAGEILTPGKLLALKDRKIYKTSPISNAAQKIEDDYFVFKSNERRKIINTFMILIDKIKNKNEIETKKYATELINEIYSIVLENYKNKDYLSQFRIIGNYKITHSLNCTILCCIVALKQDMDSKAIYSLMQAALLHDIAKILTNDFSSQKTRRNHSIAACKILSKLGFEYEILNIILNHHENLDGTGYPKNKYYDSIPKEAMIINICSFFDNLFRIKEIKTYKDAFKIMLSSKHSCFSLDISKFIQLWRHKKYQGNI